MMANVQHKQADQLDKDTIAYIQQAIAGFEKEKTIFHYFERDFAAPSPEHLSRALRPKLLLWDPFNHFSETDFTMRFV